MSRILFLKEVFIRCNQRRDTQDIHSIQVLSTFNNNTFIWVHMTLENYLRNKYNKTVLIVNMVDWILEVNMVHLWLFT